MQNQRGQYIFRQIDIIHVCHAVSSVAPKLKLENLQSGDNCIQNFHLGSYIVGYTVGKLVFRRRASGAVKRDFRTYIRRYTSTNENFECGYPHSYAQVQLELKLERYKPHKAARHQTKCDAINDVKLFPTVFDAIQSDVALQT